MIAQTSDCATIIGIASHATIVTDCCLASAEMPGSMIRGLPQICIIGLMVRSSCITQPLIVGRRGAAYGVPQANHAKMRGGQ
jgi:hypothetical protein